MLRRLIEVLQISAARNFSSKPDLPKLRESLVRQGQSLYSTTRMLEKLARYREEMRVRKIDLVMAERQAYPCEREEKLLLVKQADKKLSKIDFEIEHHEKEKRKFAEDIIKLKNLINSETTAAPSLALITASETFSLK